MSIFFTRKKHNQTGEKLPQVLMTKTSNYYNNICAEKTGADILPVLEKLS